MDTNKNIVGSAVRACASAAVCVLCGAGALAAEPANVPELMRSFGGKNISTAADWENVRRPEVLAFFEKNVFGKRPAVLSDKNRVSFRIAAESEVFDGKAVRKVGYVRFDGPEEAFEFPFAAYIPKTASASSPAKVFVTPLLSSDELGETKIAPDGKTSYKWWAVESIIDRGYATVGFMTSDVAADKNLGASQYSQGIFKAVEKPSARTAESWGTISAWAWAASRVMDWIETQSDLDAKRVAIVGHSRGGKTALWTGATDTRFAMPCSNDSGCTGAKLNHIDLPRSESVAKITENYAYWFCGNYKKKFANREKQAPYDQHWLIALCAPRATCVASGSNDSWAGPQGEWWSAKLASPVWALYGKEGLSASSFPAANGVQQDGFVSYHLRNGGHDLAQYDWDRYMDFADKRL